MADGTNIEGIENKIFSLRGHRVMFDYDLAELYGVSLKRLNEQVKRNRERFPKDFIFQLAREEIRAVESLRSQFATLKRGQHRKYAPYVFTEHGAVMLANILKSPRAIGASIQVVRAFVHLRRSLANQEMITRQFEVLKRKVGKHDVELKAVLEILHRLLAFPLSPPKSPMGFLMDNKKRKK